ncbi:MAG: hypothetical protein RI567_14365, partial [Marinobacter sp.]|nr:hypothetical protein [Marinobacter sp.]
MRQFWRENQKYSESKINGICLKGKAQRPFVPQFLRAGEGEGQFWRENQKYSESKINGICLKGKAQRPFVPPFLRAGEGSILEGKPKILRIENKRDLSHGQGSEVLRSSISEGRRGRGQFWRENQKYSESKINGICLKGKAQRPFVPPFLRAEEGGGVNFGGKTKNTQ